MAIFLLFLMSPGAGAAENTSLSGSVSGVYDEKTEPLPYANIYIPALERGTAADASGRFMIENLPTDTLLVEVRYMGYETLTETVDLRSGSKVRHFRLTPYWMDHDEVFITSRPSLSPVAYKTIQRISRQQLEEKQAVSIGEMLDDQPGLNKRSFGSAPARPVIRGFDGERVLILENGERMGDVQETAHDHAISIDPASIEEIEVIRGPASLLYGANAIGGVVNMFTGYSPRNWREGWEGTGSLQGATSNNMYRASGSIQKGWESIALKSRLTFQNAGNTTTPEGDLFNSHGQMFSASTGLGYRSQTFQGNTAFTWNHFNYGVPEYQPVFSPGNNGNYSEEISEIDILMDRLSISSQNRWTRDGFFEAIEFRMNAGTMHQQEIEWEDNGEYDLELDIRKHMISSTLTLRHGKMALFDRGAAGINFSGSHTEIGGDEAFHPGIKNYAPAFFLFEETDLSPSLSWQSGIRTEYRFMETIPNELFPEFDKLQHMFNYAVSTGLNYRVGSKMEAGLQVARAYRNPTVTELYASGWHAGAGRLEIGNDALNTEKSYGVDVYFQYNGNTFSGEVTAFANYIDDYISLMEGEASCPGEELRADGGGDYAPCFYFEPVHALMRGIETFWKWSLTSRLTATMQADVVYGSRIREDNSPLPFIPPARIMTGAEFDHKNWETGIRIRSALPQNNTTQNEIRTPGYIIPELSAGYKINGSLGHRLVLRIENPFDQTYYNHLSRVRRYPDPDKGPDNPVRYPETGRNISMGYYLQF